MRQHRNLGALWLAVATCALPALLGAKGCIYGGEVMLGENDGGLGGEATGGKASTGGKTSIGGAPTTNTGGAPTTNTGGAPTTNTGGAPTTNTGGAPTTNTGGSGTSNGNGTLPMDASGWIRQDSNPWGIQGRWYWYSDQVDGGITTFEDVIVGQAPFVPGKGMCVHGATGAGTADNFKTWGGGIGMNLNVDPASNAPIPLAVPPRCFTIVISSNAVYPGELRAEPLGLVPPGGQPLFSMLHPGKNEVCLDQVQVSVYCGGTASPCLGPESLADGVATLNITAASAGAPGPIEFCVESITPHD